MREINIKVIQQVVEEAVIEANIHLPVDILNRIKECLKTESSERGRHFLQIILDNAKIAEADNMALCQDTGLAVVIMEIGQEVHLVGGNLEDAVNQGIRDGYRRGYFRNSVVNDPFIRVNTGDNTPAIIHTEITTGEQVKITVFPKGAGSENMGRLTMLKPAQGVKGVRDFVIETVETAGGNPCPPIIVGVGVGGNMEKASFLAKKALLRPVGEYHQREDLAALEREWLDSINALGIGPQGLGGNTTALAVHIETFPTHIASLPVAVNLGCHCTRRCTMVI